MRSVGVEERRARLGRCHLLAAPAERVAEVADGLVALHATDPPTVYLSCFARMSEPSAAAVDAALYRDRAVVRTLGMRRTMFVVGRQAVPVVDAACTDKIAAAERRKLVKRLEDAGVAADGERWLVGIETAVIQAMDERGEATAQELSQQIAALREEIVLGPGTRYETRQRATSHVLAVLAAEGRIVRGRPSGPWTGTRYRWAIRDRWLDGVQDSVEPAEARAALTRRWLRSFGPGTPGDLKWWTGWTGAPRSARRSQPSVRSRSTSTAGPGCSSRTTSTRSPLQTCGWPCSRRSTRRRWAGPTVPGTSGPTARPSSIAPATSAPPPGPTGESSAGGRSGRTTASRSGCWRPSAPR